VLETHKGNETRRFPIATSNLFTGDVYEITGGIEQNKIVGWARLMITNTSSHSPLSVDGSYKTSIL
jgi:hypothetical protein